MKLCSYLLAVAMVFGLVAQDSQARSLRAWKYQASLTEIRLDPKYSKVISDGNVRVDYLNRKVNLILRHVPTCPPNMLCAQALMQDEMELPIVSVTEECGSRVITARRDRRPIDGNLHELVIYDHTTRVCEDYRPWATEVREKIETSGFAGHVMVFESFFAGGAFQPMFE